MAHAHPEHLSPTAVAIAADQPAFVSWSAALAGALIATALSLLLFGFGGAVGLSVASPWSGPSATTVGLASALFIALAYIFSIAVGGYFAGRLRPRAGLDDGEARFRDGANGLVAWAAALIAGVLFAVLLAASAAQTVASGVGAAASVASPVAAPIAQETADRLLRPQSAATAAEPSADQGATAPSDAAANPSLIPFSQPSGVELSAEERAQAVRIIARSLAAGEVAQADRAYLGDLLEEHYGYSDAAADRAVDQTIAEMRQTTTEAVEEARQATAFAGFWTAAVLLIAAIASWWCASLGGSHRDETGLERA